MNGRVSKTHARRSRVKLSKALLATLLDTATGTHIGMQSSAMPLIVRGERGVNIRAQNLRGATKRSLL